MLTRAATMLTAAVLAVGGCERGAPEPGNIPRYDDPRLAAGREVWVVNCRGCHELGTAGAPRIGDAEAWAPRIAQGREVLHRHATKGFFGPRGTMMPARGGNPALTDDQVRSAVDYMIAASQ